MVEAEFFAFKTQLNDSVFLQNGPLMKSARPVEDPYPVKVTELSEPMDVEENTVAATENNNKSNGISTDKVEVKKQDEEDDDDDDYKAEGTLRLQIQDFSQVKGQVLSDPIYVRGLPWKIMAIPREIGRNQRSLGYFLQCNSDSDCPSWSCYASATLRLKSQKEGGNDCEKTISHVFYPKENDWGYSCFLRWEDVMEPEHGYLKDDTLILEVHLVADAPHGVQWDSKKHTGYIGLKNQGATCYMNSLLQTLFFTNKLRKAVYQISTEQDDPHKSVALAMQRVFYELQFSDKPVGTKKLTRSFGWDAFDSFLQHDVQELCRVLLDNLESKMKDTPVNGVIPQLFEGKMKSYVRCKKVPFESNREEAFYDIQLNVKGKANIYESFKDYVAVETLEGDNKYDAGDYGLQEATKGVVFIKFPPVLHLQLMRVQYDPLNDQNLKINDRFEFPEKLDLDEFLESKESTPAKYTLHAVLVHSGDFHGGHYVVYINPKGNGRWCKFDDDVVSRCSKSEAIEQNYGGNDSESAHRHCTNAYMLAYIRDSVMDEILCSVDEVDIPVQLRARLQRERDVEALRKKEKSEAHLFCTVFVLSDDDFEGHQGPDLINTEQAERVCRKFRVRRTMTFSDVYAFMAREYQLTPLVQFRLWPISNNDSAGGLRPTTVPNLDGLTQIDRLSSGGDLEIALYMEVYDYLHGELELPSYRHSDDVLLFLKYYDPTTQTLIYCGHMIVSIDISLTDMIPEMCARVNLPPDTDIDIYEEDKYGDLELLDKTAESVQKACADFVDGLILVYQSVDLMKAQRGFKLAEVRSYYIELQNRVELEFIDKQLECVENLVIQASFEWSYIDLATVVGRRIGYDPFKIQFSRTSVYKDSNGLAVRFSLTSKLKDILNITTRNRVRRYRLYFQRMPLRIDELELRFQVRIQYMDMKLRVEEMIVYPSKYGTVQDLLNEVSAGIQFSEGSSKRLRLLQINSCRIVCTVQPDMVLEQMGFNHIVRVEEIPPDQVVVDPKSEFLLPVAHFYKDCYQTFGTPFYLKVKNGEPFGSVKQRIQRILEVSDKEFEKFKFALCTVSRTTYFENENFIINLTDFTASHFSATAKPWLGLDHVNKMAKGRGMHTLEKAIVIHN
ncbi:Ubiquitin carboxyl-terminal hydrolase 7 [Trichinella nelsoni]|uniref:Ubiquitin carboxyl-terminal hydrolase 7 n=2 Tax=Trichinella nelsoni TaxID=6336 RepID=A0A0V0SNV2_9BILA|nr:Ubiquitin carboxyl-terminal hydrolase 7 [Trichinella nelsoni]